MLVGSSSGETRRQVPDQGQQSAGRRQGPSGRPIRPRHFRQGDLGGEDGALL